VVAGAAVVGRAVVVGAAVEGTVVGRAVVVGAAVDGTVVGRAVVVVAACVVMGRAVVVLQEWRCQPLTSSIIHNIVTLGQS
jgi:hypothetical protein